MSEKMEVNYNENVKQRLPKRLIHFSDGSVPEYSTDEEDENQTKDTRVVIIDPASLGWWEWFLFKTTAFGTTAVNVCDQLGDSLSSFFGITTPKYQFEIDHFNMMKQLEAENSDTEMGAMNVQPIKPLDAKLEKSLTSTPA